MKNKKEKIIEISLAILTLFCIFILIFIVVFILSKGLKSVTLGFLAGPITDMGRSGGIFPAIISTIYITLVAILIATPLGIGTALYLTEFNREGKITKIIRFGTDCLAGVPSIIFGLFGFIFFVLYLKLGWSVLSGGLTLASMILPTIIRTSEEAIKAVPSSYRKVSYALGATKWQTITKIVLWQALPGIMTGIILSIGRSVGETAAVIFTAGSALKLPTSIMDPGRTMAVHFYILAREGISMENAYATASVLIILIFIINITAYWMMNRFIKGKRKE
jgi:phosphate transport system permease protein